MKKKHSKNTVKYRAADLPMDTKTNWKKVKSLSHTQLKENTKGDKETLFADEHFWRAAHLVMPSTAGKERITIRLDADILEWLRRQGRGYQSRINVLLRNYMNFLKSHKNFKL